MMVATVWMWYIVVHGGYRQRKRPAGDGRHCSQQLERTNWTAVPPLFFFQYTVSEHVDPQKDVKRDRPVTGERNEGRDGTGQRPLYVVDGYEWDDSRCAVSAK